MQDRVRIGQEMQKDRPDFILFFLEDSLKECNM